VIPIGQNSSSNSATFVTVRTERMQNAARGNTASSAQLVRTVVNSLWALPISWPTCIIYARIRQNLRLHKASKHHANCLLKGRIALDGRNCKPVCALINL
jgi:hypothetical protein